MHDDDHDANEYRRTNHQPVLEQDSLVLSMCVEKNSTERRCSGVPRSSVSSILLHAVLILLHFVNKSVISCCIFIG